MKALALRGNKGTKSLVLRGHGGNQKFKSLKLALARLDCALGKEMTPEVLARESGISAKVMRAKIGSLIRRGATNGRVKLVGSYKTKTAGCRAMKLITVTMVAVNKLTAALSADNEERERHLSDNHVTRLRTYRNLSKKTMKALPVVAGGSGGTCSDAPVKKMTARERSQLIERARQRLHPRPVA